MSSESESESSESDDNESSDMLSEVDSDDSRSSESGSSASYSDEEEKKETSPLHHAESGHSSAAYSSAYSSADQSSSSWRTEDSSNHSTMNGTSASSGQSNASAAYSQSSASSADASSNSRQSNNSNHSKQPLNGNGSSHHSTSLEKKSSQHSTNSSTIPWLMPTAVTGGGVKLGPFENRPAFASPATMGSNGDNNTKSNVLKVQLRHTSSSSSSSPKQQQAALDISNHPPETKQQTAPISPPRPKSTTADNNNATLFGILVFRLSSAKEAENNKPPLCLAKLDLTTPSKPKGDTPPTPPQRKKAYGRGIKPKNVLSNNNGNDDGNEGIAIDHHDIATLIHNQPPNASSGIMQKRLKNFNNVEYSSNHLIYGAEITAKSTRPICCAAVVDANFAQPKVEELLQLVYHKFTKQHGSYLVQNAKMDLQLQDKSLAILQEVAEKYQPNKKATKTTSPLRKDDLKTIKSLLGKTKNHDSSEHSKDEQQRLLNNLQLMVSSHSTSSSHAKEEEDKHDNDAPALSSKAPWANQKLRKTRSILLEQALGDDDEKEPAAPKSNDGDRDTLKAKRDRDVENTTANSTPVVAPLVKRTVEASDSKVVQKTTSESDDEKSFASDDDDKVASSNDDIEGDAAEQEEKPAATGLWTKMASLRSVKKDTPTITTGTNTTVSETTATYTARTISATAEKDRILTTPRSILLEENKNSSIQSTLGGSVVDDLTDHDDESEAKNVPVWAKAKNSLRATPAIKRPEKKPSLPPATKDDLRPTPQQESGDASGNQVQFSPTKLRSITPSESTNSINNGGQQPSAEDRANHEASKESAAPPPPPRSSPAKLRAVPAKNSPQQRRAQHHPWNKEAANDLNRQVMETIAMAQKPRPLESEETLRKPTLSQYDNWGLVKSHYLPSTSIHLDDDGDASTVSHSLTADGESASGASDWGVPTQHQNADDSSWVNPARPVDAKRRDKVKREVDKMFLKHLEQNRMKSLSETPLFESKQESGSFAPKEEDSTAGKPSAFLLAAGMMTRPGSFDEDKGWSMPSDTTALEISRRNKHAHLDPPSVEEEVGWSMPSAATTKDVVYRKTEEQKDYRYTYITAKPALMNEKNSNDAPTKSSYWDKIRQNYFEDGNVPLPTDGAARVISDNSYRPSWKTNSGSTDEDDDVETNDSEWLPPDYSTNPTYRAVAAKARSLAAAQDPVDEKNDVAATKSEVSSHSVWEPPTNTNQGRRIDFAGRITYQNESDSSDAIPWVPKAEDLVFETSSEDDEDADIANSHHQELDADPSGDYQDSDSDGYSSDYNNGTVYSSALKFDDDTFDEHDDEFVQNPTRHMSNITDDNDIEEGRAKRSGPIRVPSINPADLAKGSKGSSRESSSASIDASIDSVLSYTGRISFCLTPELISFEDDPNEERGTHYTKIGRKKEKEPKSRGYSSSSKYKANGPDPCVYYSLCCIMIAIPAVVLTIMFVFVIDVNGDENENGN